MTIPLVPTPPVDFETKVPLWPGQVNGRFWTSRMVVTMYAIIKSPTTASPRPGGASASNARFGESAELVNFFFESKSKFDIIFPILTDRPNHVHQTIVRMSQTTLKKEFIKQWTYAWAMDIKVSKIMKRRREATFLSLETMQKFDFFKFLFLRGSGGS